MGGKEQLLKSLIDKLVKRELTQIQKKIKKYNETIEYHERIKNEWYNMWVERADLFTKFLDDNLLFKTDMVKELQGSLEEGHGGGNWRRLIIQLIGKIN